MLPKKLQAKLDLRKKNLSFRNLGLDNRLVDFSSNDYLGLATSKVIFDGAHDYLVDNHIIQNGSTGSRLLSGNHKLFTEVESIIANFHLAETALIFNSGYNANLSFFSCVPLRNDVILYDEFCHASIRDGILMSNAKAYKFSHNDTKDLELQLQKFSTQLEINEENSKAEIYVVTESVFSMDGDSPDLKTMAEICNKHKAYFVIDEAHAVGIFGTQGEGLIYELNLQNKVFARIITFGKALGSHGAAILGNRNLKEYLINFSRPFIYTTGLSPHALATIKLSYDELKQFKNNTDNHNFKTSLPRRILVKNIRFFQSEIRRLDLFKMPNSSYKEQSNKNLVNFGFIKSDSAIQSCIISGNIRVKTISVALQENGFDVKPILSPTVPQGKERLRFCLHSYNSRAEIREVLQCLAIFARDANI